VRVLLRVRVLVRVRVVAWLGVWVGR